jgi:putative chitinase
MPRCPDAVLWATALNAAMERFDIDTPARVAAFLAQIAHESNDCRNVIENLNYSAKRLVVVWPRRFPTLESALPYAGQPERLANLVYANRLGNGEVASGDGWRFRGRGLIQLTGRTNYRIAGFATQLDLEWNPDQAAEPVPAALTAAHFWSSRGLNALADDRTDDDDAEDFTRITVAINGGRNGLVDRRRRWALAKAVLAA